jgi:hypothetical protein
MTILARMACLALLLGAPVAQSQEQPTRSSMREDALRKFLREYLEYEEVFERQQPTRYFSAFVDLNADGIDEAIVYLVGRGWCGSGGCRMLILTPEGDSYRILAKTTITHPPIRVLARVSHGWRSVSIWVRGGGILQGYEVELQFDGKTYESNPNLAPRLSEGVPGQVVIPDYTYGKGDKPLFPDDRHSGK